MKKSEKRRHKRHQAFMPQIKDMNQPSSVHNIIENRGESQQSENPDSVFKFLPEKKARNWHS